MGTGSSLDHQTPTAGGAAMVERPLLFLDVDGVVNACDPRLTHNPDVQTIEREGFLIRIQPWLRECLLELHEHFEVVWMTTWRDKAEPSFAEVLGLPGQRDFVPWEDYKLPALIEWAGDRRWAFVDDDAAWELFQLGFESKANYETSSYNLDGNLVITPKVEVGLTRKQTAELIEWAER